MTQDVELKNVLNDYENEQDAFDKKEMEIFIKKKHLVENNDFTTRHQYKFLENEMNKK